MQDFIDYITEYNLRLTQYLDDNVEHFFVNDQEVSSELSSLSQAYIIAEINRLDYIIQCYQNFQQNIRANEPRIFGTEKRVIKGYIYTENIGQNKW
jgi:hypothetical protein